MQSVGVYVKKITSGGRAVEAYDQVCGHGGQGGNESREVERHMKWNDKGQHTMDT